MTIRSESPADRAGIRDLVTAAFAGAPHGSGTEAAIVEALRDAGMLTISLVAEEDGAVVGHVAFSPVRIEGAAVGWFGLGPVAVRPERQGEGIGRQLIDEGLRQLRERGAEGCVVLGDPAYYRRFGFTSDPALCYPGAPSEYFQRLGFGGPIPSGTVVYHEAFGG
jgi:putative acetyltransferase